MAVVRDWTIINDAYFREFSPIPLNYNLDEIRPYYKVSEELWVVPLIGVALYNELIRQVNENDVTELNSTLLLKIYAYEAIAITYEALPFISYHLGEVGITKGKSENSDSVSINDVNFVSEHLRNQLELLKKYLKKFLDDNAEYYPLYKGDGSPCDCECNSDNKIFWNFYFGNGEYDKYEVERHLYECMLKKKKPNPYAQLYSTPRRGVDIR